MEKLLQNIGGSRRHFKGQHNSENVGQYVEHRTDDALVVAFPKTIEEGYHADNIDRHIFFDGNAGFSQLFFKGL
jgi:hypothetical protein